MCKSKILKREIKELEGKSLEFPKLNILEFKANTGWWAAGSKKQCHSLGKKSDAQLS